ncbi:MAG: 30S ribosomal protein S17e [Nanoarchaeota archaeon]
MGRIKTTLVKRTSKKLLVEYPDRFSPDFEKNKPIVHELLPRINKKMRNIVAGYVTRLVKQHQKQVI